MKDYKKFISFVVFYVLIFSQIDAKIPNNWGVIKPLFSGGMTATIIYLFFLLWSSVLWKIKKPFVIIAGNLIGFYDYPNLEGEWKAKYASSYKADAKTGEYKTFGEGVAVITQSYSNITLDIDWGNSSKSESFLVELRQKENKEWYLVAAYTNIPKDPKLPNSQNGGQHTGFCLLTFDEKRKQLIGFYANDENRKTRGRLTLKK